MIKAIIKLILNLTTRVDEERESTENIKKIKRDELLTSPYLSHLNYDIEYNNKNTIDTPKKNNQSDRLGYRLWTYITSYCLDLLNLSISSKITDFVPDKSDKKIKDESMAYLTSETANFLTYFFHQSELCSKKASQRCKLREREYQYKSVENLENDISSVIVFITSFLSNGSSYYNEIKKVIEDMYRITDDKVFINYLMVLRNNVGPLFNTKNIVYESDILGISPKKSQEEVLPAQKYLYRDYKNGKLVETTWKQHDSTVKKSYKTISVKKEKNRIDGLKEFYEDVHAFSEIADSSLDKNRNYFSAIKNEKVDSKEEMASDFATDELSDPSALQSFDKDGIFIDNVILRKKKTEEKEKAETSKSEGIFDIVRKAVKNASKNQSEIMAKNLIDIYLLNYTNIFPDSSSEEATIQVSESSDTDTEKPEDVFSNLFKLFNQKFSEMQLFSHHEVYSCILSKIFTKIKEIPKDKEYLSRLNFKRVDTSGELFKRLFSKSRFTGDERVKGIKNHYEYFRGSAIDILNKYKTFKDLYPYEIFRLNFNSREFNITNSNHSESSGVFDSHFKIKSLIKNGVKKEMQPKQPEKEVKNDAIKINNKIDEDIKPEQIKECPENYLFTCLSKLKNLTWGIVEWVNELLARNRLNGMTKKELNSEEGTSDDKQLNVTGSLDEKSYDPPSKNTTEMENRWKQEKADINKPNNIIPEESINQSITDIKKEEKINEAIIQANTNNTTGMNKKFFKKQVVQVVEPVLFSASVTQAKHDLANSKTGSDFDQINQNALPTNVLEPLSTRKEKDIKLDDALDLLDCYRSKNGRKRMPLLDIVKVNSSDYSKSSSGENSKINNNLQHSIVKGSARNTNQTTQFSYFFDDSNNKSVLNEIKEIESKDPNLSKFLSDFKVIDIENKKLYSSIEDIVRKEDKTKEYYLQVEKMIDFIKLTYFIRMFVYINIYENIKNYNRKDQTLKWIDLLIQGRETGDFLPMFYCLSDALNINFEIYGLKSDKEVLRILVETPVMTISLAKFADDKFIDLLSNDQN